MIEEIIASLSEPIFLILGACIGFLSSSAMWRRQMKEEKKKREGDYILRATQLALSSLTYTRSLLYSKTEGISGVLSLPETPVDELLALAGMQLGEVAPLIQKIHNYQQEIFGHSTEDEGSADSMLEIAGQIESTVNVLLKELRLLSEKNEKA